MSRSPQAGAKPQDMRWEVHNRIAMAIHSLKEASKRLEKIPLRTEDVKVLENFLDEAAIQTYNATALLIGETLWRRDK